MKTNRRDFVVTAGTGIAGLGLTKALPVRAAGTDQAHAIAAVPSAKMPAANTTPGIPVYRRSEGWPIASELKSKRIKFDTPQNQVSWAYMKELREHNKTRRIHPINPYVEVYQFRDNLYELFMENCDGLGDFFMHLIVGPEKAMLIDTGFGLGDIPGLVAQLTGNKPLIVVNTHEHPDHAFGNCRFDRVYCHEYLVPYLEMQNAHLWDYLFDDYGDNIWLQFDRKDLPTFRKYEIVGVKDGHTFNLGGDYDVELAWTAGHTPGHAMYIDKKSRYLFCGDDVCSDVTGCGSGPSSGRPNGQFANIKTYRDCLTKLVARRNEFDYLFPGHFMVNLENSVLVHLLEALDAIVANPDDFDYKVEQTSGDGLKRERFHKFVKGFGTVAYTKNGVYPPA